MTLSFRARLWLGGLVAAVVALVVVGWLAARQERAWVVERDAAFLERLANHVAFDLATSPAAAAGDWTTAVTSLSVPLRCRVTVIDSTGRVLGDSEVPVERLPLVENHAGRPEVQAALDGHIGHAVRRSATVHQEFLYVAVPASGLPGAAVVRVAEPLFVVRRLTSSLMQLSIVAAMLGLALTALLFYWITGLHLRRVAELERIAARIGSGDLSARARELPTDELGRLGQAMNRMAAELRERVQALEHERDEREHVLAHMSDGVTLLDGAGRIVHANRAAAALLGAALPPPPGTPFQEMARFPELDDLLRAARQSDRPIERELRLWTPEQRLVRVTATRLLGAGEGQLLLVLHDLSEAELLNRVRQDFVANVSHELKTPLTSLRGYAETLLEGGLDDLEHREQFVRVIRDQALALSALVDDLLSLAELERPDMRLVRERFDLREAVERQAAALRERARQAGLELRVSDGPAVHVVADRKRVEQVVANLLDNAVKYTERGSVVVTLGEDSARAWCEVTDTGPGIPAYDLPRIFERFYRVDKARSRETGGTGLGLSIVKHIVMLHGGEVSVKSTVGQGSTFRFELPRAQS